MNAAIDSARQARSEGSAPNPSALHRLAKEDAGAILNALQEAVVLDHSVYLVHGHLTVDELAATIYRHAMYEAGAIVDARTKEPYPICPHCAYEFPA